jgi:hypothetical protein
MSFRLDRRVGTGLLVAALAAGASLPVTPAAAQAPSDVDAARQLFREGSQLSQEGKWEQARARFEQSLQLRRAAITLYSLGIAQKQTGRLVEALESLRAFSKWPPNEATDPYQPIAREMMAELEKRVSRVLVSLVPAGAKLARLEIDGTRLGDTALDVPRLVNPGRHEIRAVGAGQNEGREGSAEFVALEGAQVQVTIELGKRLSAPAAGAASAAPSAALSAPPPPPASAAPPASTSPPVVPPPRSRALPIALVAGGGSMLLAGGIIGMLGVSQARSAPSQDSPEVSSARSKALIGDVLGGLGLVATGVGVYLLFSGRDEQDAAAARPALGAWFAGSSAGVAGRF